MYKNLTKGIDLVLMNSGSIIVLKDDLFTDRFFAIYEFWTKKIRKNKNIILVHSYTYPSKVNLKKPFFLRGTYWGRGT